MIDIFSLTKTALEAILLQQGIRRFRADQIFTYIYGRHVFDWDEMILLPKKDRDVLKAKLPIYFPRLLARQEAADGETVKLLLELHDGETVETVLMKHDYGNSVCLSSQVGCAVNCAFCASAKNGFVRNLSVGEMVVQLLAFRKYVTPDLHSVVIMGTGEPLLNYDNVLAFLRLIHEKDTFYLGYRNMALSTSGIVPAVDRLAAEGLPLTLAISLHGPTNAIRRQIMPLTDTYDVPAVIAAGDRYFAATGRKVTYEYILIKDVNCTPACAEELARLMKGKNILINLIPINDTYDVGLRRPARREIDAFAQYLKERGIPVTLRREMGSRIRAACGQLRIRREQEES